MSAPRSPLVAKGNRIFDADGREVAVATRADPALRVYAEQTAAEMARRWNHFEAIVRPTSSGLRGLADDIERLGRALNDAERRDEQQAAEDEVERRLSLDAGEEEAP